MQTYQSFLWILREIDIFFGLALIGLPLSIIWLWRRLKKTKKWIKILLLLIFTLLYIFVACITYLIITAYIGFNPHNPGYTGPEEGKMIPQFESK